MELLAPGGDLDSIKAAIVAGANAIYCGLDKLNARHRAENLDLDTLTGVLALAHEHDCQVYLTLNTLIVESDIAALIGILNRLANTSLDGIIVQDLGLFYLLAKYFEDLEVHASTQLTTHNRGQIRFLRRLGATRVNLCRELSLAEIEPLVKVAHQESMSVEVFVHGSYCISFSGICYMSSVQGGGSGNRGLCSQPCRERYQRTGQGSEFPLNLKDNLAYFELAALADAGVDAMKIEGRMKAFHYVYAVTEGYRRRLDSLYRGEEPEDHSSTLHRVFNRGFSNGFMEGDVGRDMFSEDPRNQSAAHLQAEGRNGDGAVQGDPTAAYELLADFKAAIGSKIEQLSVAGTPLRLRVSGRAGSPLSISVQAPNRSFTVCSESCLTPEPLESNRPRLTAELLRDKLKALKNTEYFMEQLDLDGLEPGLFVPMGRLKQMRNRILSWLNGGKEPVEPLGVPALGGRAKKNQAATLSVLVSSTGDLPLCEVTPGHLFFELPNNLATTGQALGALFSANRRLSPWFPSILIGEDYAAALNFLRQVRPKQIVTNNTGIAYHAWKEGIPWIAGPQLNTGNSFGMLALKETFDCRGAFISNELGSFQIKRLEPPDNFELYYSIYHPGLLLTSRQCLFQQVTGCEKHTMDNTCLGSCEKSSTIERGDGTSAMVHKTKGTYCCLYHQHSFLNTEVVTDIPSLFSSFLIDLRQIPTQTKLTLDKSSLIRLFERHLRGDADAHGQLKQQIVGTTNRLYKTGI